MSRQQRPASRRAGPVFGVLLVVLGTVGALTPAVPTARAEDVTPPPSAEPIPTPTPTPEPTQTPDPTPVPEPTPVPTQAPDPTPPVEPSVEPSPPAEPEPSEPPLPSFEPEPSVEPSPSAEPSPSVEPSPSPSAEPGGPGVAHAWIESPDDRGRVTAPGRLDTALADAQRFTVYRVRFQLVNDGEIDVTVQPALEVAGGSLEWTAVPLVDPVAGRPFYGASDDHRVFNPRRAVIAVKDLRLATAPDPLAVPVPGQSAAGQPMAAVDLPAHSYTEVEFAVRGSVGAHWETAYEFRLLDGERVMDGESTAEIVMGSKPAVVLSPGQRKGDRVDEPLPLYRLDPSLASTDLPLADATGSGRTALYALTPVLGLVAAPGSPHVQEGLTSDTCASCHATHTAQSMVLLQQAGPQSQTCFTCHDGTGASTDVQRDWASATIPANDPATSSWYSHPATTDSNHGSGLEDEFGGTLNRHSTCADCHQTHRSDGSPSVGTVGGWSSSGAIAAAGSVSVTNGPAGSAPAYSWQRTSTFEYELCFKCHSGYTTLPEQDPAHPSRWALDKAIELNPANVSYHPVEGAGKNQTAAMAASLEGTSPYKLWRFTTESTIRCQNCHGDSAVADPLNPPDPGAGLDNHASPNRGILIAPYRDRDLKPRGLYQAQDFALCYVCHAEAPMVDDTGDYRSDTNFHWHGYHLGSISGNGVGGLDIDVRGAGQGNAVCAECHFRTHGSALAVDGQAPAPGLVNFSPNVIPLRGYETQMFVAATPTSSGSCTLSCHGKSHLNYTYDLPTPP